MHILLYHKTKEPPEQSVTSRAAARAHMLHKTIWWDIGLVLWLAVPGMLGYWYAPVLRNIPLTAWLVPVNGSPWEQCKPLFWGVCFVAVLRWCFTGTLQRGILTTYAAALLQALGGFIAGYYITTGVWRKEIPLLVLFLFWLNTAVLLSYLRKTANSQRRSSMMGAVLLLVLTICFVLFTYRPPQIGLFSASQLF
ncbi:MAG: hypothetical protein K5695_17005 [Oscillospiraceae bacterium]|nr:hypothetical protein [Oscillospiraceae bacterium]